MANTPNMNISLPTVSVTAGPTYATQLNNGFSTVDEHNHTSGKGVQVPTAGIGINADLSFFSYNATALRSTRYSNQGSPLGTASDLNCVYFSGGNLYVNDGSGNQIQLTAAGALNAATLGSISGLGATTATVSYSNVTKTFTFWQNTNTSAKIDTGPLIVHDVAASALGITVQSPVALGAAYNFVLPTGVPASTKIMTMNTSGEIGVTYGVDNSTIEVAASVIQVKDAGITRAKMAALDQSFTNSSGSFTSTSAVYEQVTNLSLTKTVTGRLVVLNIQPDGSSEAALTLGIFSDFSISIFRDASNICSYRIANAFGQNLNLPFSIMLLDDPPAGTVTYTVKVKRNSGSNSIGVGFYKLWAYEIY